MPETSSESESHGLSVEEIITQLVERGVPLDELELRAQVESMDPNGRARYFDRHGHTVTVERYPDGKYGFETSEPLE